MTESTQTQKTKATKATDDLLPEDVRLLLDYIEANMLALEEKLRDSELGDDRGAGLLEEHRKLAKRRAQLRVKHFQNRQNGVVQPNEQNRDSNGETFSGWIESQITERIEGIRTTWDAARDARCTFEAAVVICDGFNAAREMIGRSAEQVTDHDADDAGLRVFQAGLGCAHGVRHAAVNALQAAEAAHDAALAEVAP